MALGRHVGRDEELRSRDGEEGGFVLSSSATERAVGSSAEKIRWVPRTSTASSSAVRWAARSAESWASRSESSSAVHSAAKRAASWAPRLDSRRVESSGSKKAASWVASSSTAETNWSSPETSTARRKERTTRRARGRRPRLLFGFRGLQPLLGLRPGRGGEVGQEVPRGLVGAGSQLLAVEAVAFVAGGKATHPTIERSF